VVLDGVLCCAVSFGVCSAAPVVRQLEEQKGQVGIMERSRRLCRHREQRMGRKGVRDTGEVEPPPSFTPLQMLTKHLLGTRCPAWAGM
jgi:hypothetical protein